MKTVLLIGKMNELLKDIGGFLQSYFRVQLCVDNTKNAIGMMKVVSPDIVVISLIGLFDVDTTLFGKLAQDYPGVPVLTIGTEAERNTYRQYYEAGEQFENLTRPLENSWVLKSICRRLDLSEEEVRASVQPEDDGRRKILVVDDNATTLRAIKGMLEDQYQIMLANSGMKAMTSIGKLRPDLILLDYEMPVCDGRQTLEMIQADEELRSIPVVFLTGVNDRAHIEAVLALRPAGYLLKPPVRDTLIDTIERVLAS